MAVSLNGLKEHDKALVLLEEIKDCGDNTVKLEYNKTLKLVKEAEKGQAEFY